MLSEEREYRLETLIEEMVAMIWLGELSRNESQYETIIEAIEEIRTV